MSDSTLGSMTFWDDSPFAYIGLMALAVLCLWLSLRFLLLKRKRRGLWQRVILVSLPVLVSLLILVDFITYLARTYRYILSHPNLW